MRKMDCMGISGYYKNLPRGKKDSFAREVAETICRSTQSAQKKMVSGRLSELEIEAINKIIVRREE